MMEIPRGEERDVSASLPPITSADAKARMRPSASDPRASEEQARAARHTSVYVYEAPLRLWHWTNAASMVVLAITGYLIASPLPTMPGEATDNFVMGYIRFAHFAAAYIFAIGYVFRFYWSLVGNSHSKQLFRLPIHRKTWWKEMAFEMRWYLFLEKRPKKYIGHNPLAQAAMFVFITLGSLFMIVTGFALYGEGTLPGSWANEMFGWVIPLFGQSQDVHTWHHFGMWFLIIFTIIHVYAAIREDIMSRQSMVSTMISGHRTFKDDDPD